MGPVILAPGKMMDCRGVRYKAFQLLKGDKADVMLTCDPVAVQKLSQPTTRARTIDGIVWTRLVSLSKDEPYATHQGLVVALRVECDQDTSVVMMGLS